MPLINTADLSPDTRLPPTVNQQVYCALDSMVMLEAFQSICSSHQGAQDGLIYRFERALQAPYLEIMQRGFLVDDLSRRQAAAELQQRETSLQLTLNEMAQAFWGKGLNPRSPAQLKDFFYSAMGLPEVWLSQKGERKLSTNREALEKLDEYLYARPFISAILKIRELAKQREVFEVEIDSDSRLRTSYNISGTTTGRSSSSENAHGTGSNVQNVASNLRYVFVADPGWKLCQIDGEQAEARDVGFLCGTLFNDWSYLDAVEKYDLHTYVTKQVWPTELPWTGDWAKDKKLASETLFYRDFDYRFMAKRGAHLSNYCGTAWTASRSLKMPLKLLEEFQAKYILGREETVLKDGTVLPAIQAAFPCIPRWWQWVAQQLQTKHFLISPFGRKRHFFGRIGDDSTLREAVAHLSQSMTADRMSLGMWRIWKYMPEVQLLGEGYDSVIFQYQDRGRQYEDDIINRALKLCEVPLKDPSTGRTYICPGEAKIGWNWGPCQSQADVEKALANGKKPPRLNPGGMAKWLPGKADKRERPLAGLKRVMTG